MRKEQKAILIAEDNDDDAMFIRLAFRQAGFDDLVQIVGSPRQALQYLKCEEPFSDRARFPFPDLIVLDHNMPGDCWELIGWVRGQTELNRLGANAYHMKPMGFDKLVAEVRRIGDHWLRGGGASINDYQAQASQ